MKFVCNREELIKNLNIAQRATDPKSNVMVLRNVLFELKEGKLALVGYDHRIGIRTALKCGIETEGAVTVPCGLLLDVLGAISGESVDLSMEDNVLTLQSGKSCYSFNCIPADDFPPFPKTSGGKKFTLPVGLLEKAVRQTIFATNPDDPRPFMGGVYMGVKDGELVFVSTDGHRLTLRKAPDHKAPLEEKGVIIPSRTLNELLRILPSAAKAEKAEKTEKEEEKAKESNVKISVQDDSISFEIDDVYVISRLVKAEFPNFEKVLPSTNRGSCRVARLRLISAVTGAAYMARAKENQNIIELQIEDNVMKLMSSTQDVGSANEEIDIDKKGDNIKVSFNSKYVLDFLRVIDDDELVIDYSEELKATLFHTDAPDYKYVLMPIKI
jgi:DNA polymerase III subunit beta